MSSGNIERNEESLIEDSENTESSQSYFLNYGKGGNGRASILFKEMPPLLNDSLFNERNSSKTASLPLLGSECSEDDFKELEEALYSTCSKLTTNWTDMENQILLKRNKPNTSSLGRWDSHSKKSTIRSNRARLLMSANKSQFDLEHAIVCKDKNQKEKDDDDEERHKLVRMGTLHELRENHKRTLKKSMIKQMLKDEASTVDSSDDEESTSISISTAPNSAPVIKNLVPNTTNESLGSTTRILLRAKSDDKSSLDISSSNSSSRVSSSPRKRNSASNSSTSILTGSLDNFKLSSHSSSYSSSDSSILGTQKQHTSGHFNLYNKRKKLFKGWKKKLSSSLSETDMMEKGKMLLNDIRIESNPYIPKNDFIESVKKSSNLIERLGINILWDTECMFYNVFEIPDSQENIQFSETNDIVYCSLFKFIQSLVHYEKKLNFHLMSVFLLSYRMILSPSELMELLIYRAFGCPKKPFDPDVWRAKNIKLQSKIHLFLCNWVEQCYYYDFEDDAHMLYMLANFEYFLEVENSQRNILRTIIGQRKQKKKTGKSKRKKRLNIIKNSSRLLLEDLNPTEIARQLALSEFDIYRSINPLEFAHANWCKSDKHKTAPNILRMIAQFNSISNWVASEILKKKSVKDRAVILNRFIIIAEESRAMRNFNSVMAILSGLQSTPIYRLQKTWNLLPELSWDIWDDLNALMSNDNNYANYRQAVRTAPPPCIPYIGVFLTDLVFIEESQEDYQTGTGLINVSKLEYMSSILFILEGCKKIRYDYEPIPALQACLLATTSFSEKEQREYSLAREPLD